MSLAVYGYPACPYCARVISAIDALDAPVEFRDTLIDPAFRREMIEACGPGTVPVLRMEDEAGEITWMRESADIVAFLYERFGEGKKPPAVDRLKIHRAVTVVMWALLALGMFVPEKQSILWFVACALGAGRSFDNGFRLLSRKRSGDASAASEAKASSPKSSGAFIHFGIGAVFLFACVAIGLREVGYADIPWWYAAYALVGLLALMTVVLRQKAKKKK